MTIEITEENFTRAMEEAVRERGEGYCYQEDYDGPNCKYQVDGQPACLIGLALDKLGVPYDESWEHNGASDVLGRLRASGRVMVAAHAAQRFQDIGHPWGAALEAYKKYLEA